MVESNYDVKITDMDLVLFPYWRCELTGVDIKETETVVIDAVLGRSFSLEGLNI